MTENGKIFLTKKSIYNLLAQQQFSIGLSLYIIKDIQQELGQTYNNLIQKEISQISQNQNTEQQKNNSEQQIIDLSDSGVYPVEWIPDEEEYEEKEDQAD